MFLIGFFKKLETGLLQWTLKWGEGNSNSQVQYPNAVPLIALFVSLLKMIACCSLPMNAESMMHWGLNLGKLYLNLHFIAA